MTGDACTKPTDRIRDLEITLFRLETRRTVIEERLAAIKKEAARIIEEKYLAEKPPELSNAQKRSDATDDLLRGNPEAQALEVERGDLDIEIRCTQIDLGFEHRQFRREYARMLLIASGASVEVE